MKCPKICPYKNRVKGTICYRIKDFVKVCKIRLLLNRLEKSTKLGYSIIAQWEKEKSTT